MRNHQADQKGASRYHYGTFLVRRMGRVTITLDERDHLALKLLALQQDTKITLLLHQAIEQYLDGRGAYDLVIQPKTHH